MRLAGLIVIALLSFAVATYALAGYSLLPLGTLVHPDMRASFLGNSTEIYLHVFAASLALLLGPLQFIPGLRVHHPQVHRWSGRLYLGAGVLIGGLAGLWIASQAHGGPLARIGFACLALAWLYSGAKAYLAIRSGDVATHRRWMVRNFSLSFAAVTLRLYIPLAFATGLPFETAYAVIAWLCWVPNLLLAERWFNREHSRVLPHPPSSIPAPP